jgi:hypothetical protein
MNSRILYSLLTAILLLSFVSANAQDPRERYGTYFGGSKADCFDYSSNFACNGAFSSTSPATTHVTATTVDGSGNIYIAGDTDATDLPTTSGAYSRTVARKTAGYDGPSLSSDTFVAKFGSRGNLIWSTYLGVPPAGPVEAIAADSFGNVTVVGTRFIDADCRCSVGTTPPFILKLNSTGSTRTYYNEVFGPQPCADGRETSCLR